MTDEDQFKEKLARQHLRPIPPAWRAKILTTARAAASPCTVSPPGRPSQLAIVRSVMAGWLWPHPRAWAGLAAVWLLVLGLDLAGREPSRLEVAGLEPAASAQVTVLLNEQKRLLAELIGPKEGPLVNPAGPTRPKPRSECGSELRNA